jgi:hypothetical protein
MASLDLSDATTSEYHPSAYQRDDTQTLLHQNVIHSLETARCNVTFPVAT